MRTLKIDLFFIGQQQNLSLFGPFLDQSSTNKCYFTHVNTDVKADVAALRLGLSNSNLPFIVYDAHGATFLTAVPLPGVLGKASLFELMHWLNLPLTTEDSIVAHALSDGVARLRQPEVNHVVLGNSYGLYAFPASRLRRAVNLATHSLSLMQIDQLSDWLLRTHPHIAHFTVCGGHFDPYYTLMHSKDGYNHQILCAWSLFASRHRLSDYQPGKQQGLPRNDAQLLAEVATFDTHTAHQAQLFANLENEVRRRSALQATAEQVENTISMDESSQRELAIMRGKRHSKSLRYGQTLTQNKSLLAALAERLVQAGKQIA